MINKCDLIVGTFTAQYFIEYASKITLLLKSDNFSGNLEMQTHF